MSPVLKFWASALGLQVPWWLGWWQLHGQHPVLYLAVGLPTLLLASAALGWLGHARGWRPW